LPNRWPAVKEKPRLNVLIVSEQSRLGRDTIRTLALIQALNDSGVKIWSSGPWCPTSGGSRWARRGA
jgi:DNA invertase Pin-like site-specific DNA recombinase